MKTDERGVFVSGVGPAAAELLEEMVETRLYRRLVSLGRVTRWVAFIICIVTTDCCSALLCSVSVRHLFIKIVSIYAPPLSDLVVAQCLPRERCCWRTLGWLRPECASRNVRKTTSVSCSKLSCCFASIDTKLPMLRFVACAHLDRTVNIQPAVMMKTAGNRDATAARPELALMLASCTCMPWRSCGLAIYRVPCL